MISDVKCIIEKSGEWVQCRFLNTVISLSLLYFSGKLFFSLNYLTDGLGKKALVLEPEDLG